MADQRPMRRPSIPDYSPGGGEPDVVTINRTDAEYAKEKAERGLHDQEGA
jgi:hypothetical protein